MKPYVERMQWVVWLGVVGLGLVTMSPLSAQEPKLRDTLKGHGDEVYSVAFIPDGKTLASGSFDKTIKLWDVATGKEQATLTGSGDQTIKLWDVAKGKRGQMSERSQKDIHSILVWGSTLRLVEKHVMNESTPLRNSLCVSAVAVVTIFAAVFASNAIAGEKKTADKGKNHEITISMLKPPKLSADKKVTIRVTVVNKSSHEIEGNGTIVLRNSATGETLVTHLPGMVKQKTLVRDLDMVNAPDQCISCFTGNDVRGHWFRTYSPDKPFLSVTIELRD